MAMSGFICHDDYLQKTAKLTDEEVGRLFRALMQYHATGEEKEIAGRESIAFDFIREDIDRTEQAYKAKCDKNRENRMAALENNRQRPSTSVNVRPQKEKEEDKEKEKDKKRFDPPTLDEVTAYMKEIGCDVDPQYFLDYQEARNWVLSNGKKAKDWKAVIRTWAHNNFSRKTPERKVVNAQQYSQRDYENEDAEAFRRMLAMETG